MIKLFLNLVFTIFLFSNLKASVLEENYLGSENAKYILIEYASLSCVHCANFHNQQLPNIKKDLIDTGILKYVFKDFPLDKPAMIASMLSNCYSGVQYFEVLKTLFKNQKKWVVKSDNREDLEVILHSILKIHGVTLDDVRKCTADNEKNKKKWNSILEVRLDGQKLGVNSTPSFFLNGKKLEGLVTSDSIKELIK